MNATQQAFSEALQTMQQGFTVEQAIVGSCVVIIVTVICTLLIAAALLKHWLSRE